MGERKFERVYSEKKRHFSADPYNYSNRTDAENIHDAFYDKPSSNDSVIWRRKPSS